MKYLKFLWQVFVITICLYIVRPAEAFYKAMVYGARSFCWEFKDIYNREGWGSMDLYGLALKNLKEAK